MQMWQASFRCVALVMVVLVEIAPLSARGKEPAGRGVAVRFASDSTRMISVPVKINNQGPYEFMLDTGSTLSMVDAQLAAELELPQLGQRTMRAVLETVEMPIVQTKTAAVGDAVVAGLHVGVSPSAFGLNRKFRGLLGEDFLGQFDLLLDYWHSIARFGGPGELTGMLRGKRLPLLDAKMSPGTGKRLVLAGTISSQSKDSLRFLLDSGASLLTLFGRIQDPSSVRDDVLLRVGGLGSTSDRKITVVDLDSLWLGKKSFSKLIAIGISNPAQADTDGLLPTSLFASIFISAREGYVIIEPVFIGNPTSR